MKNNGYNNVNTFMFTFTASPEMSSVITFLLSYNLNNNVLSKPVKHCVCVCLLLLIFYVTVFCMHSVICIIMRHVQVKVVKAMSLLQSTTLLRRICSSIMLCSQNNAQPN